MITKGFETTNSLKNVFTSSTCSVVNGPPYLDFPRSILEGMSSSQYVRELRLTGALCLAANLSTRKINFKDCGDFGSMISHFEERRKSEQRTMTIHKQGIG